MHLSWNSKELQFGARSYRKTIDKSNKGEETLFYGEKGRSWEGLFRKKTHWRKTKGRGVKGFSLAELLGWSIPCRRCNTSFPDGAYNR